MITADWANIDLRRLGAELRLAREKRGLTQEEAARLIGASRTTMVAIEKGDRRLKAEELLKLAEAYGRHVSDLVRPRPVIEPFRIQYRGPAQPSDEERAQIKQYEDLFEGLCRDYVELEEVTGSPMQREYPPEYVVEGLPADQVAEDLAAKERNRLGFGTGPLGDLRSILEEKVGVRVFLIEMRPASFSEMYYFDDRVGACMAVNRLHPPERRLWSLSHGYLHFLVHRYSPVVHVENVYRRRPESEQLADFFALFFTMPTSEVRSQYNRMTRVRGYPTPADLCLLADYFGVSVAAMARRLEDMRLIPTGVWERLVAQGFKVREAQRQLGIGRGNMSDSVLPLRYQYLVLQALEQGLISEGRFARFLRVDRLEARSTAEELSTASSGVTDESSIEIDLDQSLRENAA